MSHSKSLLLFSPYQTPLDRITIKHTPSSLITLEWVLMNEYYHHKGLLQWPNSPEHNLLPMSDIEDTIHTQLRTR